LSRWQALATTPPASIGMYLAKTETVVFFRELLARVDSIALAGKPAWIETSFFGRREATPINFRASEVVAA
jgi:hypothetical protein